MYKEWGWAFQVSSESIRLTSMNLWPERTLCFRIRNWHLWWNVNWQQTPWMLFLFLLFSCWKACEEETKINWQPNNPPSCVADIPSGDPWHGSVSIDVCVKQNSGQWTSTDKIHGMSIEDHHLFLRQYFLLESSREQEQNQYCLWWQRNRKLQESKQGFILSYLSWI